jgi:hypothetical protein
MGFEEIGANVALIEFPISDKDVSYKFKTMLRAGGKSVRSDRRVH